MMFDVRKVDYIRRFVMGITAFTYYLEFYKTSILVYSTHDVMVSLLKVQKLRDQSALSRK